jgi:hypothetical protein
VIDFKNWQHKDVWRRTGDSFAVEVTRHIVVLRDDLGLHEESQRWCVYAYILPGHKKFKEFNGCDLKQKALLDMPLHKGPSFLEWSYEEGGHPVSIKIGADYNHLDDKHFTQYYSPKEAHSVFQDADLLFVYLALEQV